MRQNYFIHNGKQYNAGDQITISFFDVIVGKSCKVNAKFLYYDIESMQYHIEVYGKEYVYNKDHFHKNIYSQTSCNMSAGVAHKTHSKKCTFADELSIYGLFIAWMWYIFIMAVAVIFYDRAAIWIFASVIFFNYRKKKLKEVGYK